MSHGHRIVLFVIIVCGVAVGLYLMVKPDFGHQPTSLDTSKLSQLPRASKSKADFSHLSNEVLAPTNSWISGAVLQKQPQPIYPQPLALQPNARGLMFSAPKVSAVAGDSITAPFTANNGFSIEGAHGYQLTRYDGISAELTYTDYGTATFAEGSPFIWYRASRSQTLKLDGSLSSASMQGKTARATAGDTSIIAASTGSHSFDAGTIQLAAGDAVVFAIVPKSVDTATVADAAHHPITSVTTTHQIVGTSQQTTLTYHITDGGTTILGALPYMTVQRGGADIGSLDGLYGRVGLRQTNTLHLRSSTVSPRDSLAISSLTTEQKSTLDSSLKKDAAAIKADATTSYAAGKQLYSAANLLQIAHQLGDTETASQIATKLTPTLKRWLRSGFYYDPQIHGIAPKVDNFGADAFNDHHFHYGYFIYAADIVAHYDHAFLKQYQPYVDLLVADIASPQASRNFPAYRVFDAYAGHSWASGTAPFADGNNQESSSEAVNAWNAVALWGETTHNTPLASTGKWLLANEAQSAQKLWLTKPTNQGYSSPLVDINWGGKRVYQTWFSADPVAKLAIQLIPMNPLEQQTLTKNSQAKQLLATSMRGDDYNLPLGDYDLTYLALIDPSSAASRIDKQTTIDSANSRTYLQAWVMTAHSQ